MIYNSTSYSSLNTFSFPYTHQTEFEENKKNMEVSNKKIKKKFQFIISYSYLINSFNEVLILFNPFIVIIFMYTLKVISNF